MVLRKYFAIGVNPHIFHIVFNVLVKLHINTNGGDSPYYDTNTVCSRPSGLLRDPQSRAVQQVRLRCTEGAVEWMYPSQALRVVLEPNLSSARHSIVCIKPFGGFGGASAYVERAGQLHLLVTEGGRPEQVYCFRADGPQKPAIFLQATLQTDIGRRTVGFRYELLSNGSTAPGFPATLVQGKSRWKSYSILVCRTRSSFYASVF